MRFTNVQTLSKDNVTHANVHQVKRNSVIRRNLIMTHRLDKYWFQIPHPNARNSQWYSERGRHIPIGIQRKIGHLQNGTEIGNGMYRVCTCGRTPAHIVISAQKSSRQPCSHVSEFQYASSVSKLNLAIHFACLSVSSLLYFSLVSPPSLSTATSLFHLMLKHLFNTSVHHTDLSHCTRATHFTNCSTAFRIFPAYQSVF